MDMSDQPDMHDVGGAIDEAKQAAQHLREVAPGSVADAEPDEASAAAPAEDRDATVGDPSPEAPAAP